MAPFLREEFKKCRKSLLASVLGRNDASNHHLQLEGGGGVEEGVTDGVKCL